MIGDPNGFPEGIAITLKIEWMIDGTPATGITGTAFSIKHDEDGTVMGPIAGSQDGSASKYKATLTPTREGLWHVRATTTPAGGVAEDVLRVRASKFV